MKNLSIILLSALLLASCTEDFEHEQYKPFVESQVGENVNPDGEDYGSGGINIQNDTVFDINGVKFKMIRVEGGTFMMGNSDKEDSNAQPTHKVTLSTYYIAETETTQELYKAVMGNCPSSFYTTNSPVGNINRYKANDFIQKLRDLTGFAFNLPTEAQWEFAARGGNKSHGYLYSGSNDHSQVAITFGNVPHAVATRSPNELGIYDMSGNIEEPCHDGYAKYTSSAKTNPIGPVGTNSIYRGGGYETTKSYCTVYIRTCINYNNAYPYTGMRLAIW